MSRRNERYKLVANFLNSTAVGTAVVGFVNPEIANWRALDTRTLYDPYLSLLVAIVLIALGWGFLGGLEED